MVRRSLRKHTEDAIRTVVEDVPRDLITNWCKHIKIEQETVSLLGQMTGLPIGPKRVECPYFSGWSGMRAGETARLFIEANCHGCPHHEEVHPNNIGRDIMSAVAERRDRDAAEDEAKAELQGLAPSDALAALDQDVDSDAAVKELAGLLIDDQHKRRAVSSLLQAAEHHPEFFSRALARALRGVFVDPDIGSPTIRIVRELGKEDRGMLGDAVEAAKGALERSANEVEAAGLLVDGLEAGIVGETGDVAGLLVDSLSVPHHFLERAGRGRPTEGVEEETRRLAKLDFAAVRDAVLERLASSNSYVRAKGAAGAKRLIEVDAEAAEGRLFDALVKALAFEDDEGATDATIHEALAMLLRLRGQAVADRLFEAAERFDVDVRGAILETFGFEDALEGDVGGWLSRLIEYLGDAARSPEDRESIGHTLSRIARDRPKSLTAYLDELLGILAMIAEERCAARDRGPKDTDIVDTETFFRHEGILAAFDLLLRLLKEAIVYVSLADVDTAVEKMNQLLVGASTEVAGDFKAQLLDAVGDIGHKRYRDSSDLIPVIFPHLLDPKSARVRTRAAEACADLVSWARNVLPDEVLIALTALLADEYLGPVRGAVRSLGKLRIEDSGLATTVAGRLIAIYRAYKEDRGQFHFVRDILEALRNVANQHAQLIPAAASVLRDAAEIGDYYTAEDCLREFAWFALGHEEYQAHYVESVVSYYKRFRLTMVSSGSNYGGYGQSDHEFERLYEVRPEVVRSRASDMVEMALAQEEVSNRVHVALLFAAVEMPDKAAELIEAYAAGVAEPRLAYERDRFHALASILKAEAAVVDGKLADARNTFEDAAQALSNLIRPRRGLPFGLDQVIPQEQGPDPYVEWLGIRQAWLDVPEEDHNEAAKALEELATRMRRLGEEEVQERDDEVFVGVLTEVASGARHVCLWFEAVRMAHPNSGTNLDAARARLAEAAVRIKDSRWGVLAGGVQGLAELTEALTPTSGMRSFLRSLRLLPVPFPRLDLPFGAPRFRRRPGRKQITLAEEPLETSAPLPVAFVKATVDGLEAPQVTALVASQVHDIQLEIELSAALPGAILHVVPISVIPPSVYEFPRPELRLADDQKNVVANGNLLIRHASAPGAGPMSIKVALEAERDGERQPIDVFGHRTLSFRVAEKDAFRKLTGEQNKAVQDVLAGLDPLVPALQDGHRENEESVIAAVVRYAAHHLQNPFFKERPVHEKDFQRDLARHLWLVFEEDVLREVMVGRGYVDTLVRGVPVELKVAVDSPDVRSFVETSLPQATQYTVSRGRRVGMLVVLDMSDRTGSTPRLQDDVAVYQGPTVEGLRTTGAVGVVTVIVRGAVVTPSALPRLAARD